MNLRAEIRIGSSKTQLSFVNSASFSDLPNSRCTMKRAKHWGDLNQDKRWGLSLRSSLQNGKASYYSNCICLHRTLCGGMGCMKNQLSSLVICLWFWLLGKPGTHPWCSLSNILSFFQGIWNATVSILGIWLHPIFPSQPSYWFSPHNSSPNL